MVVNGTPVMDFTGTIRKQDIRATEKDSIQMQNMFRPGDIVKCEVLSLGDTKSYYLTTSTSNEYGVIHAKSQQHHATMIPVSWDKMKCTKSGCVEWRKVAKPSEDLYLLK